MKTTSYLFALVLTLSSFGLFAQTQKVNTEKSTINWLGKKIGGQHEGLIKLKNGVLEEKNGKIVSGSFVIDMTSLTNTDLQDEGYNKKLVGHLKSDDFFGVEKFPTATLNITKATKFSNGKASVTGNLTIKGKTESITFDFVKNINHYTAKIEIDRSKFNVRYGSASFFDSLGDKAINDIFTLDVKLVVN
ncbi:YceI family protein [Lacinutrix jangbogonensis]|uniref:YceI family protein n=1 Tax=Lacinutrix jangbogonensis TaxID=1469557 RepID=UPI00053D2564|nr:YceI family protein [Lacinutrix jangbogonensis]